MTKKLGLGQNLCFLNVSDWLYCSCLHLFPVFLHFLPFQPPFSLHLVTGSHSVTPCNTPISRHSHSTHSSCTLNGFFAHILSELLTVHLSTIFVCFIPFNLSISRSSFEVTWQGMAVTAQVVVETSILSCMAAASGSICHHLKRSAQDTVIALYDSLYPNKESKYNLIYSVNFIANDAQCHGVIITTRGRA